MKTIKKKRFYGTDVFIHMKEEIRNEEHYC